jgi:hypothetical protein
VRGSSIERTHTVDLVRHAQLQMVLEILADAAQILHDLDAEILQPCTVADAGEFEQLRRVDRAGTEDDFTTGFGQIIGVIAAIFDTRASTPFEHDPLRDGAGDDSQIGALECRAQKRFGGIPADAALLVDVEVADAAVVAAIEVVGGGDAGLLRGLREGLEDFPFEALLFDAPWAACAMRFVGPAVVILAAFKDGEDVVPGPGSVIGDAGPFVVVFALAAHVDHAVDG